MPPVKAKHTHTDTHSHTHTHRRVEAMETLSYPRAPPPPPTPPLLTSTKCFLPYPISTRKLHRAPCRFSHLSLISATLNTPRGFGPSPKKIKKSKKQKKGYDNGDDDEEDDEEEEGGGEEGVIPEIVTNRMMSRMAFSVGIPLLVGLCFFPFFYYLKVGLKIDVPPWIPFIVSFIFFGTALLGVSYGIVSSSWDPMREGSLLGWNEAQKNWPVFWQSIWGGGSRRK